MKASTGCIYIAESRPDVASLQIVITFASQAFLSLCLATWFFFVSQNGGLTINHPQGSVEYDIEVSWIEFVADLLMMGNDFQMLLGIFYMAHAFFCADDLDVYHTHLIFDIVSFVGVSNAAALICWSYSTAKIPAHRSKYGSSSTHNGSDGRIPRLFLRHLVTCIFGTLFLGLTALVALQLSQWDADAVPGRCYKTNMMGPLRGHHPTADKLYIAVTAGWLLGVMLTAILAPLSRCRWLLVVAMLQFPVHFCGMVLLRAANVPELQGTVVSENQWDFGETSAVLLLVISLSQVASRGGEFRRIRRELLGRRERAGFSARGREGESREAQA